MRSGVVRIAGQLPFAVLMVAVVASPVRAQVAPLAAPDLQKAVDRLDVADLEGRRWTAASLRGRVVLIDFWATWCAPCLAQLPELARLRDRYGERFEILAISLDGRQRRDVVAWLKRQGISWPQVHDGRGFSSPAARSFGVRALPASVLVADGAVVGANLRGDALEDAVRYFTSTSSLEAARVPIVIR